MRICQYPGYCELYEETETETDLLIAFCKFNKKKLGLTNQGEALQLINKFKGIKVHIKEKESDRYNKDINIESIFSNILSFYTPDGNPEIFKKKIEQYKSELLSL